jgi:hypothetical protein
MSGRLVQIANDPVPRPTYEVDEGEYQRLIDLGLVVNAPAEPADP